MSPARAREAAGHGRPPDGPARERIRDALDVNLLVEAGAGSGKTTSLVDRLMAYVARGDAVDRLAAVTFTRKAAGELRERFQLALERAARDARARAAAGEAGATDGAARYEQALGGLDGAFLGTIHAFCARLLRERPIAAGIDPSFQEVTEVGWDRLRADFWRRWVEARVLAADPLVAALPELGVAPTALGEAFARRIAHPDVDFTAPETPMPDVTGARRQLEGLLERARPLLPDDEPDDGWDRLQLTCRAMGFRRGAGAWREPLGFLEEIGGLTGADVTPVLRKWSEGRDGKEAVKALGHDFAAFLDGPAADLLRAWREHRYPAVMRVLDAAMRDFERERLAAGMLGFEDLLLRARDLLRDDRAARRALGERYARLLVDEFQDTDPIQAEICFLLAADPETGDDWRTVALRPGALFVVGDPKQSIYRFRRASFDTYRAVKERFRACGEVLRLTACFRCAPPVAAFVDAHFRGVFPAADTEEQAAYAAMDPWGDAATAPGGVSHYRIEAGAKPSRVPELETDARVLATWIATRVAAGTPPGAFLVLTPQVADTTAVARELGARNVPVSVTGGRFEERDELAELLVVLRALADPDDPVAVVAALTGWCFGLGPDELLAGRDAGLAFTAAHPPATVERAAGRALGTLHAWWARSREWPLEEVVEQLLDETGLLALAAASELGERRAGALGQLVGALREAGAAGSGIAGLVDALQDALAHAEGGAPLRPEQHGAVRVMNLHKAKGLEADVVVLAAPADQPDHAPLLHVARSGDPAARSGMVVTDRGDVLAQPADWAALAEREERYAAAERARLLYVAATRARRELVVARLARRDTKAGGARASRALWAPFEPALERLGTALPCAAEPAPGRQRLEEPSAGLRARIAEVDARRDAARRPTVATTSVTRSAKEERDERRAEDADWSPVEPAVGGGRGRAWGRAVHRVIEARGRGRTGESLAAFARAVAADEGLVGRSDGDGVAAELVGIAERVLASQAGRLLAAGATPRFEWTVAVADTTPDGVRLLTEGTMDAAVRSGDGWDVLDWKSDEVAAGEWEARLPGYEAQVRRYAEMLARLRGEPATGRLWRTSDR